MAIIDVLKYDGPNDVLVWKWQPQEPKGLFGRRKEELRYGTQLVVNQSQIAVFLKDGRVADIFAPGRYTLSSKNLPILDKIVAIPFGKQSPFKAEVYYINKAVMMDTQFELGAFNMLEPNFRVPIPLKAYGSFAVRVGEARMFMQKIIGTIPNLGIDEIRQYFRGVITENIKAAIGDIAKKQNISPLELEGFVLEISTAIKPILAETLEHYGLKLELLNIEGVSIVDDDPRVQKVIADYQKLMSDDMQERMRLKRRGEFIDVYKTERTFDTTEAAASNIGGSGVGGEVLGTMVGMNMVGSLGNAMGTLMNNAVNNSALKEARKPTEQSKEKTRTEQLAYIQELWELKEKGILTEEEFNQEKKKILEQ